MQMLECCEKHNCTASERSRQSDDPPEDPKYKRSLLRERQRDTVTTLFPAGCSQPWILLKGRNRKLWSCENFHFRPVCVWGVRLDNRGSLDGAELSDTEWLDIKGQTTVSDLTSAWKAACIIGWLPLVAERQSRGWKILFNLDVGCFLLFAGRVRRSRRAAYGQKHRMLDRHPG